MTIRGLGLTCAAITAMLSPAVSQSSRDVEFFENRIRPVLLRTCLECHGPKKTKAGLRLDSRAALMNGGDSGPSIVPGAPEKSLLIVALKGADEERVTAMPYKKTRLDARIIADFESWIRDGASWGPSPAALNADTKKADFRAELIRRRDATPAFQPLRDPPPPAINPERVADPLDAFVLKKLDAAGLSPAPPADRRTLLRRLTFDLIGLPPSPEEIEAFVRDRSPGAVKAVVDRLLDSPHFGEKWARHWLDLVRFGESRGHEFDYVIPNAYHYRDYVIRALNADLPYPRFVQEHIAGDLLPDPRTNPDEGFNESILATGWWYLGEWVHSPVDTRADEMDRVANQIEVFGKTFLGLTVSCARCHDHKFDAISQADYYALAGFIKSSDYRQARFDTLSHNRRVARDLRALERAHLESIHRGLVESSRPGLMRLAETLSHPSKPWKDYLARALKEPTDPFHSYARIAAGGKPGRTPREDPLRGGEVIADYGKNAPVYQDGSAFRRVRPGDLRIGKDRLEGLFFRGAAAADPAWADLRLAAGTQKSASKGAWVSSGRRLRTPTFTLKHPNLYYLVRGAGRAFAVVDSHRMLNGPLHGGTRIKWKDEKLHWQAHGLGNYVERDAERPDHHLHVEFTPDSPGFEVLSVVQGDRPPRLPADPLKEAVDAAVRTTASPARAIQELFIKALDSPASPLGSAVLDWAVRHSDLGGCSTDSSNEFLQARRRLVDQLRKESRTAVAIMDGAGSDERLLIRGNAHNPGPPVPRRYLEAFGAAGSGAAPARSGRLDLARRMVDPQASPLLYRVRVNRIWHQLFGRGLVASADNFGNMGSPATHPELLEFLASRFVEEGGSLKRMVRRIVLSKSYRMSGTPAPEALKKDPTNALLHRMPVRRLPAEAIRDAMLSVSGRLDGTVTGPSVPVHLNAFQDGRGKPKNGPLDGAGRRSVYLAVRRNFLSSMMLAFDFPQPFSTIGRRSVSNVPTQALFLKNGPFVRQQAGVWAEKLSKRKEAPEDRIRRMFLAAFGRAATDAEIRGARSFVEEMAAVHRKKSGDRIVWQDLAHALFQAKEFILLP